MSQPAPGMSPESEASYAAAVDVADYDLDSSVDGGNNDEVLSDLPSVKRQQVTSGYREGLAAGKAQTMQTGFDKGYPIGIELALRVGRITGILEGYLACKSIFAVQGMFDLVQKTYADAKSQLDSKTLLSNITEAELGGLAGIPKPALAIIERWEGVVCGVWVTRHRTMQLDHESTHGLREMVENSIKTGNDEPDHDEIRQELTESKAREAGRTGDEASRDHLKEGWLGRRRTYW